jgi:Flp pilus assembly protein TadG
MVEMAIVLPLLVLLVFGLIDCSRLGMVTQILNTAAREACRVAAIDGNTNADVTARLNQVLNSSAISGVTVTQTPTDCTTVHSSDNPNTVTVTLSVPFRQVTWLGTPFLFQSANVSGSATMSSERP